VGAELGGWTSGRLRGSRPTLLVPLGSTEQHGPHLPLDTDTRIAHEVATGAARELAAELGTGAVAELGTGAAALVAPAIPYGASGEHQGFPGTISIGTDALCTLLVEYVRSASDWAHRVLFVNGHGGNVEALRVAVPLLRTEGRDAAWCGCTVEGADAHAGHTETSLLLHLCPERVGVRDAVAGNCDPLAELMPRLRAGGIAAVSESGVLGDPSTATAEAGARYLAAMVTDCAQRLRRWEPGPGGMLT
jgi:mycofactocin system creatininase family protein